MTVLVILYFIPLFVVMACARKCKSETQMANWLLAAYVALVGLAMLEYISMLWSTGTCDLPVWLRGTREQWWYNRK